MLCVSGTLGYEDVELETGSIFGILQAQPVFVTLECMDVGESEDLAPAG